VHTYETSEALIDTGALHMVIPPHVADQLGLPVCRHGYVLPQILRFVVTCARGGGMRTRRGMCKIVLPGSRMLAGRQHVFG